MIRISGSILVYFILTLAGLPGLRAQNFIRGSVTDSSGTPLPFCAMALVKAVDSSQVKGYVSDEKGEYVFEKIQPGTYRIRFSNIGYKEAFTELLEVDSATRLTVEPLSMKLKGKSLDEVAVTAFKPVVEFRDGMTVMNVENNILSAGNTVFELLKRLPGVMVDAQNNISLNGRGNVRFLIDGRLQQIPAQQMISLLQGMPAESVSSIEIISNPPAKYDAAGTGGLINIVLKKIKVKGFSGSLSQSASKGDNWRGGTFGTFNYKTGRISFFSNVHYNYLQFESNNSYITTISDSSGTLEIRSAANQRPFRNFMFADAGLEYEITGKSFAGISFSGNGGSVINRENGWLHLSGDHHFSYDNMNFKIATEQEILNPTANAYFSYNFDSLTSLQLAADYTRYQESGFRFTNNQYFSGNDPYYPLNRFGTAGTYDFNVYTQKVDFNKSFGKSWKLESGLKSAFTDNRANSVVQLSDPLGNLYVDSVYSQNYRYYERILASYASLSASFKKVNAKLGLRAEETQLTASNFPKDFRLQRSYFNIFPSGSVDFRLNEKNNLQFVYAYRINRPNYDQLNPTRIFNDPFSNGAGNPNLRPNYVHGLNASYSYNNFITLSSAGWVTLDNIYYYSYADARTKITTDTVFNFGKVCGLSMNASVQKQIKWFSFQCFAGALYRDYYSILHQEEVKLSAWTWWLHANTEFLLPADFKLQVSGFYNGLAPDGVQVYYPMGVANLTLFKSLLNKKLDVSLSLFDVFYTDYRPFTNKVGGLSTYYFERNDSRRFRLWLSWKFGNMKIRQKQNRSNEEEKGRMKQLK